MKKLIAMIGAVAMGFCLFAADSVVTFATSFEAPDVGVDGTTFTPGADWTWEGDPFTLGQYDGDAYDYTRSGEGRRQDVFKGTSDQFNYLPLKTENKELKLAVTNNVLDQLVKFTGFEDPQTNLVEGAKIAVWMSGVDADADEGIKGETNLYVTCAKVTGDGVEPIALKLKEPRGNAWATDKWYRLTIQNIGDIYKQDPSEGHRRCGFIVYVDGKQVEAEAAAKQLIVYDSELTDDAGMYMRNGQLFPAFDTTDLAFNSVSYKGIGAIDDIIVDNVGPEFAQVTDCKFTIDSGDGLNVVSVYAGGTELKPGEGGEYTVTKGMTVTITWGLVPGYKVMGGGSLEPTVVQISSDGMAIKPSDYGIDVQRIVATVVNANDLTATNVFAASELYTMINELVDDDTATFLEAVTIWNDEKQLYEFSEGGTTIDVSVEDDVTIWEIESAAEGDWIADYVGAPSDFIKNYTFKDDDSWLTLGGQVAGVVKAATIDDVSGATLSGEGKVISQIADLEIAADEGEVEVLEDTPEEGWYTYQVRRVDYATFTVKYNSDEVDNVSVKTNGADVAIIEDPEGDYYQVFSNEVVTIAAESKDDEKRVWIKRNGVKIDGTFTADANGDEITIEAAAPVTITLPNLPIEGVESLVVSQSVDGVEWTLVEDNKIDDGNQYVVIAIPSEDYRADNPIKDGTAVAGEDIEVTEEDVKAKIAKIPYVAQIGSTKYESLKEAVEAAQGGDTIEVIANCEVPETICFYNTGTNAEDQITLKNDFHVELTTGKNYSIYVVNANVKVTGEGVFSKTNGTASAFVVGSYKDAGKSGRPAELGYGVLEFEGKLIGGVEALSGQGSYSDAPSGMIKVEAGFCNFVGGEVINWRDKDNAGKCVTASGNLATNEVKYVGVVTIQAGTFKANEPLLAENDGTLKIIGKDNTAKVRPLKDEKELDYSAYCEPGYTFLKVTDDQDPDYGWYKIGMKTFSIVVLGEGCYGTANPNEFTVETDFPLAATLTKPTAPKGKEFDSWSANFGEIDGETLTIDAFPNENVIVTVVWKDILVTSVTLDITSTNVAPNEAFQLTATVLPEGAADKTIAWTTSDEGVATVEEGVVTAVAEGTATITATNAASGCFAICTVTVESAGPAPIPHDDKIEYTGITAANETEACDKVQIKSPDTTIVDDATYAFYFNKSAEPTGVGVYTVTATLKPEITKAAAETAELADQLDDLINTDSSATISITTARPGLWYSLNQGQTLAGREEDTRIQAKSTSVNLTGTHFDGSGFYQIMVNTAPNLKED